MAYCAIERNGTEVIFKRKPHKINNGKWSDEYRTYMLFENTRIVVPKGTIKKITGFHLKYNDEPIKLQ